MTINLRLRPYQIIVASTDVTALCAGNSGGFVTLRESLIDTSGHIQLSGSITLRQTIGSTVEFDPRQDACPFARGARVQIYVAPVAGGTPLIYRTARILKDPGIPGGDRQTIEIQIGDLLSLLNFAQPPGEETLWPIGETRTRTQVINQLINSIGGPSLTGSVPGWNLLYPMTRNDGGVVAQAAKIAYEAGYALWVNEAEQIVPVPLENAGIPLLWTFEIGKAEYRYEPIRATADPFERLLVFGLRTEAGQFTNEEVTNEEVTGEEVEDRCISSEERFTAAEGSRIEKTKTCVGRAKIMISPFSVGGSSLDFPLFIDFDELDFQWRRVETEVSIRELDLGVPVSELKKEIEYYYLDGRIRRKYSLVRQVLKKIFPFRVFTSGLGNQLRTVEFSTVDYNYDSDLVLRSVLTTREVPTAIGLRAFIPDPDDLNFVLFTAEETLERYRLLSSTGQFWRYTRQLSVAKGLIAQEWDPYDPPTLSQARTLQILETETSTDQSRAVPPAPPAVLPLDEGYQVVETPLFVGLQFRPLKNPQYRVEAQTFEVESAVDTAQLERVGAVFGTFTLGRQYGHEVLTYLPNGLLASPRPLFGLRVLEPGYEYQAIAEGHSLVLGSDRTLFGFQTVFLGGARVARALPDVEIPAQPPVDGNAVTSTPVGTVPDDEIPAQPPVDGTVVTSTPVGTVPGVTVVSPPYLLPLEASGGLAMGGSASVEQILTPLFSIGGLAMGGSASLNQPILTPLLSIGGLALGGSASVNQQILTPLFSIGGLAMGGSASVDSLPPPPPPSATRYEAEDATINSGAIESRSNASGGQTVSEVIHADIDITVQPLAFSIDFDLAGTYELVIGFSANAESEWVYELGPATGIDFSSIDGQILPFFSTGDFNTFDTWIVEATIGADEAGFQEVWLYPASAGDENKVEIDYIDAYIVSVAPPPPPPPPPPPTGPLLPGDIFEAEDATLKTGSVATRSNASGEQTVQDIGINTGDPTAAGLEWLIDFGAGGVYDIRVRFSSTAIRSFGFEIEGDLSTTLQLGVSGDLNTFLTLPLSDRTIGPGVKTVLLYPVTISPVSIVEIDAISFELI